MRGRRSLARLPRVIPDPGAGRAPAPTGSAPAASGPIERHLQEAYRAIADMSVAISTSSAESRENARHAATSASFSYVPRSAPVASSITVNFAGCCSARNSDPPQSNGVSGLPRRSASRPRAEHQQSAHEAVPISLPVVKPPRYSISPSSEKSHSMA